MTAEPDARILLFTSLLAVATAMLSGVIPAFRSTHVDSAPTLKGSGGGVVAEQPRLRKTLVVAQVALSFLLLIGAGLFLRSLHNLMAVDPGFRTERVLRSASTLLGRLQGRAVARVLAVAARRAVTAAGRLVGGVFVPVAAGWRGMGMGFTVDGYQPPAGESAGSMVNAVSPGYFSAMGIPLLEGREFDTRDDGVFSPPDGWPYRSWW